MKLLARLVFLAVVLALGVWLWMRLFPSPEKVIRTRLTEVSRCASFDSGEGAVARFANVSELTGYFMPDAKLYLDGELSGVRRISLTGRDEIGAAAVMARNQLSSVKVRFVDINVTLGADRQTATADLTARVAARGDDNFYVGELLFILRKTNGLWMVSSVEPVKVLR